MRPFDFDSSIHVVFGLGIAATAGEHAVALSSTRAFLVTDPGVRSVGLADRVRVSLEDDGIPCTVWDGVTPNPTNRQVEEGFAFAREVVPDLIVAVGGGSAMDAAKGVNFLLTNGGRIEDFAGFGRAKKPMLSSIGVPTTGGTGSEAQSYALISRSDTHEKFACGDRKARFSVVLLDPEMIATTPANTRASAGLDALSHAVESAVTRTRNPISDALAGEAWRLLDSAFDLYYRSPDNAEVAGDVLVGAHLAGTAVEASMLGAAHACANPLTARYGIVHGTAVALMLPHVVRFNAEPDDRLYARFGGAGRLIDRLSELKHRTGLPERLSACGVQESDLGTLAQEAETQWTGAHNPRAVDHDAFMSLYASAL